MRLKLSFDDIKILFRYLDKDGNGSIGYPEFTLLLEERWRGLYSPKNIAKIALQETVPIYDDCLNDREMFQKLEKLASN